MFLLYVYTFSICSCHVVLKVYLLTYLLSGIRCTLFFGPRKRLRICSTSLTQFRSLLKTGLFLHVFFTDLMIVLSHRDTLHCSVILKSFLKSFALRHFNGNSPPPSLPLSFFNNTILLLLIIILLGF